MNLVKPSQPFIVSKAVETCPVLQGNSFFSFFEVTEMHCPGISHQAVC